MQHSPGTARIDAFLKVVCWFHCQWDHRGISHVSSCCPVWDLREEIPNQSIYQLSFTFFFYIFITKISGSSWSAQQEMVTSTLASPCGLQDCSTRAIRVSTAQTLLPWDSGQSQNGDDQLCSEKLGSHCSEWRFLSFCRSHSALPGSGGTLPFHSSRHNFVPGEQTPLFFSSAAALL